MAAMAKSQKSNRTNIGPAYERSGVRVGTPSHTLLSLGINLKIVRENNVRDRNEQIANRNCHECI